MRLETYDPDCREAWQHCARRFAGSKRQAVSLWELWSRRELNRNVAGINTSFLLGLQEINGALLYLNLGAEFGGLSSHEPHSLVHHPIVQRLLAEDERRAAEASSYSWHQPVYRGPDGTFLLKLHDDIAWHWTDCGFDVSASRAHDVVLSVSSGGYHCRFEVRPAPEPKEPPRRGRAASPGQFQLWFDRERDRAYRREPEVPALTFDKTDKAIVPKATSLLLARWERAFRDGVKWRYENAAQERQRAIRAAEEAARRERERLEAEARALLHKRQRLMMQAFAGLRRSDEIRALVAAVEARVSADGIDADLVMAWKSWVLETADRMDLRAWPASELGKWLESFHLRQAAQP